MSDIPEQFTELKVEHKRIEKIGGLSRYVNLIELSFFNNEIYTIENLEYLTRLERLDLARNKISLIENLDILTELKELTIWGNQIPTIENLEYLTQLECLDLARNKISKIENLDRLTELRSLNLSENPICKIENLDYLTRLNTLKLEDNKISKIENLDKLTKLKELSFSGNYAISRIENLDTLVELEDLCFENNKITTIENLDHLTKLKNLDLYGNRISKIENLDQLTNLESLDLSKNSISKIENLDKLTKLKTLYIMESSIEKIENLESLVELRELCIGNCGISTIENLESLTKLDNLDLAYNSISKIENLDKLTNLEDIQLQNNEISRIEGLENLCQLTHLDVSDNCIERIEGLDNLHKLRHLDISNNYVRDISYLPEYFRENCPEVIDNNLILRLEGNPIDWSNPENHTALRELRIMGIDVKVDVKYEAPKPKSDLYDGLIKAGIPEEVIESNKRLADFIEKAEREETVSANKNFHIEDKRTGAKYFLQLNTDETKAKIAAAANFYLSGELGFIVPSEMPEPEKAGDYFVIKQKELPESARVDRGIDYWIGTFAEFHNHAERILNENAPDIIIPESSFRDPYQQIERLKEGSNDNLVIDPKKLQECMNYLAENKNKVAVHGDAKPGNRYGRYLIDLEGISMGHPGIDLCMVLMDYNVPLQQWDGYLRKYLVARNGEYSEEELRDLKKGTFKAANVMIVREIVASSLREESYETNSNNQKLIEWTKRLAA